ncbi:MAG: transglutaminase-like domain-containing protein [bacterium]|nr:transglutaminase-like domain-containing protein [bacterium]
MKKLVYRVLFSIFILLEAFTLISIHRDNCLFDSIIKEVANKNCAKDNILALLDWVHINVKVKNTGTLTTPRYILTYGSGCGGFAKVFAVLVRKMGIPARLLFSYKDGVPVHVVTEVYYQKRWVVFDPYYKYYFPINDTLLATAEDLKNSSSLIEKVVDKKNYPFTSYIYQDVRRTNWNRIPIILPAVYKLLKKVIGDRADRISLNILALRPKITLSYCLLLLIIILLIKRPFKREKSDLTPLLRKE